MAYQGKCLMVGHPNCRISVLRVHGNVGCFLYECDKYIGWHQWIRGRSIDRYCIIHHTVQLYRNVQRQTEQARIAHIFAIFHDAVSDHIIGFMDTQQVSFFFVPFIIYIRKC